MSITEPIQLIGMLVRLQDDLAYLGECVADNLTGEAKFSIFRTQDFVEKTDFPSYIKLPVNEGLAEINDVLRGNRDLLLCRRRIQDLRRRLANEVAFRVGLKLPYSAEMYPPLTNDGSRQA